MVIEGPFHMRTLIILVSFLFYFLLLPFLYIIWNYSYPFVYRSFLMGEVSREAGGMPALYILKSAILWFCLVLFLRLISNVIKSILTLINRHMSEE